ncbi:MAG: TIGR00725 family protein [Cellulomonas sp. 73-92]|uniref:TIGR00725 family protein n=1 Tax=Cellulomonas sp. 73-92 TaxID=1895740 RepID=UPI00092BC93B|nr:TIGR00725 family protein [Cellulomonas sp. 73-92]OJV80860.1 MAG: TIGR00725 family protein [Cellulomonas sp. 73-92]
MSARRYVAVVGPSSSTAEQDETAERLGGELARRGHVVVCGGGGGVMAAVSRGSAGAGGLVVGLLPGLDRTEGNPHLTVAIPTGLGELRNWLVVRAADVVVAVGGSWGTLSEVALAVRTGVPVVALGFWNLPDEAAAGGPAIRQAPDLDAALAAVDRVLADA